VLQNEGEAYEVHFVLLGRGWNLLTAYIPAGSSIP
jgi:hypothetical protein